MQNYDLNRLGDKDFETLVQSLLKKVIGPGTTTFGAGPDGGREATFTGSASYPSSSERWDGEWIFQAKFHDVVRLGPDKARQAVLKDLRSELDKILNKYGRKCDNYILATNVPLSSVPNTGTHDQIASVIIPEFCERVKHIHVWGYDDLARFLEGHADVRKAYLHLLTPGDLIAELMAHVGTKKSDLSTILQLYLRTSFDNEQYAQLDQAGEVDTKPLYLRSIFIDLDVSARNERDARIFVQSHPECAKDFQQFADPEETFSACKALLASNVPRAVLIGGPGQGKSTLCQFVAQIHRAYLLQRLTEVKAEEHTFIPLQIRLPFRVVLKDYAQWISASGEGVSLEAFIAQQVHERTARTVTPEQVQDMVKQNPTLLILDGLDEVTDRELRKRMLGLVFDFIARAEVLRSDMQIVCTSRPTGYTDQFDPAHFFHLVLATIDRDKISEYTTKWIDARKLDVTKSKLLMTAVNECVEDPNFSALMNTPLQVTIFILIILSGGTPPRQREELFNEYLEVIYKRERAKSKTIIQTEKQLLFGLHQFLGYLLHRRAAATDTRSKMSQQDFREAVLDYLRHGDPYSPPAELHEKAEQIIREAHERLVLLVQPEDGFFGFELRSIQEFFAAGYLVDTAADNAQRFERFQAIAIPPHWRNVALFFAGRIGRMYRGESAHVLETCREIDRHKPDVFVRKGAWLALDIAVDRSFGPVRPLQRSALEIALGITEGDLPPDDRKELISKLKHLPDLDVQQHVLPLLEEKVKKVRLDDGFAVLEVFCGVTGQRGPVRAAFERSLSQTAVPGHILLRKALEYRLDASFIAESLGKHLSDPRAMDELTNVFSEDPSYVVEVLKAGHLDVKVAAELCLRALESYAVHYSAAIPHIHLPLSELDQGVLAFNLFSVSGAMRSYGWRRHGIAAQEIPDNDLVGLMGLMVKEGVIPELKAAAWALASVAVLLRGDQSMLTRAAHLIGQIDREELLRIESVLRRTESPSLEVLIPLAGRHEALVTPSIRHSWFRLGGFAELRYEVRDTTQLLAWIFSRSSLEDSLAVLRETAGRGKRKVQSWGSDPTGALITGRLAYRLGGFWSRPDLQIPTEWARSALEMIRSLVTRRDPSCWYALQRLSWCKWSGEVGRRVLGSLRDICVTLEKTTMGIPGLPLAAFIARVAEMKGADRYLEWLLKVMLRALPHEPRPTYRRLRGVRKTTVAKIARAARGSEELEGFARWFAWLDTSLRPRPEEGVEVPKLQVDRTQLLRMVETKTGDTRGGAVLILANTLSVSYEEANKLLRYAEWEAEIPDCWLELIEGTVKESDDSAAIGFLEHLLSTTAAYSKIVKYAALSKYEEIARSSTIDIVLQEKLLGLPLQDILHVGKEKSSEEVSN